MPSPKTSKANANFAAAPALPLPTLLSQVLVAFTIEFDNEFEHQTPHRITRSSSAAGSRQGPWLASLVMWSNLLRFVAENGIRVRELQDKGGNLAGMERWGYIVVEPDPTDGRSKPPRADWIVRLTAKGQRAGDVWRPLFGAIEKRWQARFGEAQIEKLRESLDGLVSRIAPVLAERNIDLPEYLPVLGYGLWAKRPDRAGRKFIESEKALPSSKHLSALLAQVLFAFAIEFEKESDLSLAICANVIRILTEGGVRGRDLPRMTGVSAEAIKMSLGFLEKGRYILIEPDPAVSRTKLVRLTPMGLKARKNYTQLLVAIEKRWQARFGNAEIGDLRESLEHLVEGDGSRGPKSDGAAPNPSPLFLGLEPYREGWRASVPKPETLPHYPMVLHRGGYPDGS